MGKGKQRPHRHSRRYYLDQEEEEEPSTAAFDTQPLSSQIKSLEVGEEEDEAAELQPSDSILKESHSKYHMYQLSVQSPKGDISYLLKFFLTYVGGRSPVHLREDFCGTALICAEWVKGGIQRVATGLDLDLEALTWGFENNITTIGVDACSRVRLLHGNVLDAISVAHQISNPTRFLLDSHMKEAIGTHQGHVDRPWPGVDIVCAFNYSCCCLHKRSDLVKYFKFALESVSKNGGIFAMDLYGGVSSETPLKLRRHYSDFTYIWEQEAFDVTSRMTRISLHFQMKNKRMIRHAFTYEWRLWTLPELRDCFEEAGFDSVHFWMRKMPTLDKDDNEAVWKEESKYKEVSHYNQDSAWNAYIVAVAHAK